jgi:hypothetical protein
VTRIRDWARSLEQYEPEDQWMLLCTIAGQQVELEPTELNGALRRSELLLAAGGDPHRRLELYGRSVTALADDLDAPAARRQLDDGLAALGPELTGLHRATEALRVLRADPDLAWHCFAASLLAAELGAVEPDEAVD